MPKKKSKSVKTPKISNKTNVKKIITKKNTLIDFDNDINEILTIIQNTVYDLRSSGIKGALISYETSVQKEKDPFKVLISCIISLRTKDEVTGPATERLFNKANTPQKMSNLSVEEISKLIYPAGFYKNKANQIKEIASKISINYNSKVPEEIEELLNFKGVGRKTANLVITQGFNKPGICVDTHVARITQRIGYVPIKGYDKNDENKIIYQVPDKVEFYLRDNLPKKWWIPINDLLVTFGQNICVPISPKCSICPISDKCNKIGIKKSR